MHNLLGVISVFLYLESLVARNNGRVFNFSQDHVLGE